MENRKLPALHAPPFVPTRQQRLLHELNNSLAAVQLRLGLVAADATCMWAQRQNLEAIAASLEDARELALRLEDEAQQATSTPTRQPRRSRARAATNRPAS